MRQEKGQDYAASDESDGVTDEVVTRKPCRRCQDRGWISAGAASLGFNSKFPCPECAKQRIEGEFHYAERLGDNHWKVCRTDGESVIELSNADDRDGAEMMLTMLDKQARHFMQIGGIHDDCVPMEQA
jgi:hypothetical protein